MADPSKNRVVAHPLSAPRVTNPYPNRGNVIYPRAAHRSALEGHARPERGDSTSTPAATADLQELAVAVR
jgi:hypothetical protein